MTAFRLTRIHVGLGMPEIGVQFDMLNDEGQTTSTQRAFVVVADDVLAPLWGAAQLSLTDRLSEFTLDTPPEAVTTALMRQRAAEQCARLAEERADRADKRLREAEARLRQLDDRATRDPSV